MKLESPICKVKGWSQLLSWEIFLFEQYVLTNSDEKKELIKKTLCNKSKSSEHYAMFKSPLIPFINDNPNNEEELLKLVNAFYLSNDHVIAAFALDFDRSKWDYIADVKQMIQGNWVSGKDENSSLLIQDSLVKELYTGKHSDFGYLQITNVNCEGQVTDRKFLNAYLRIVDHEDIRCYEILNASEEYLSLRYETGQLLGFKRKQ